MLILDQERLNHRLHYLPSYFYHKMSERICFVTTVDLSGTSGQNIATRQMVGAFANHDSVEIHLIAPEPLNQSANDIINDVDKFSPLPSRYQNRLFWHLRIQSSLIRTLRHCVNADILVSRLSSSQIIPPLMSDIFELRYVLLIRGLGTMGLRRTDLISVPMKLVAWKNMRSADKIIAAYQNVKDNVKSFPGVNTNNVSIFPNAADVSLFLPQDTVDARSELNLPFSSDDIVIGFVGSLRRRHMIQELVQAVAKLRSDGERIKLLIVGSGPIRDEIEIECEEQNIGPHCEFTGFISHENVPAYISACDIMYGAVDPEVPTNPIKSYEYLACERPVITSNVVEMQFVDDVDAGILLDEVTSDSVYQALTTLATTSKSERESMGERGRSYIVENHSWSQLVETVLAE